MRIRLSYAWDLLRSSLWFIPTAMAAFAIISVYVANYIDRHHSDFLRDAIPILYTGGPEGARQILSTVAGSMITVAGVTFSITIVALTLASSQFGPRLLRNFMRDRANQLVLGTFVATFIYCILVLPTVRGTEERAFVPYLSVSLGVLAAMASLAVFIYFMHHISTSMQADVIVEMVAEEFDHSIGRIFPSEIAEPDRSPNLEEEIENLKDRPHWNLTAAKSGYLKIIDEEKLLREGDRSESLVEVIYRPGNFIAEGMTMAKVWPSSSHSERRVHELREAFVLGHTRTITQDIEFAIDQLVEIACRALSPGINDPYTAISCVDRITQGLLKLQQRDFPSPYRYGRNDRELRIITCHPSFEGICNVAFNQIRQYGASSVAVVLALMHRLAILVEACPREDYRNILIRHARLIVREAENQEHLPYDLEQIRECFRRVAPLEGPEGDVGPVRTIKPVR